MINICWKRYKRSWFGIKVLELFGVVFAYNYFFFVTNLEGFPLNSKITGDFTSMILPLFPSKGSSDSVKSGDLLANRQSNRETINTSEAF